MDELLSLKGLITVTVSSLLTIKAMRVNVRISRDINVNGNGNTVVVNEALRPVQKSFKLLWQVLLTVVILTYPFFGNTYNTVVGTLALISIPLVLLSFLGTMRIYGTARFPDVFYVIGTLLMYRFALAAQPYLAGTAQSAQRIYPTIQYLFGPNYRFEPSMLFLHQTFVPLLGAIVAVLGFAALLLSLLYLLFAYIKARDFDDALRFSLQYTGMGIIGFILACNVILAVFHQDTGYIGGVFKSLLP